VECIDSHLRLANGVQSDDCSSMGSDCGSDILGVNKTLVGRKPCVLHHWKKHIGARQTESCCELTLLFFSSSIHSTHPIFPRHPNPRQISRELTLFCGEETSPSYD